MQNYGKGLITSSPRGGRIITGEIIDKIRRDIISIITQMEDLRSEMREVREEINRLSDR